MSVKRKRSAVWTYFTEGKDGKDPTCTICNESVKTAGNTSNLLKHLKNKHHDAYQHVHEEQEEMKRLKEDKSGSCAGSKKQVTLSESLTKTSGYRKDSQRRKIIDDALIKMLALDLQPASIVEDRGFLNFMEILDPRYTPPSRRTIMRNLLPQKYEAVQEAVKVKLANVQYCAVTTDIWTSRATQGYITVTCHFLDASWELHSIVLDTVQINESHTAENIAMELMRITDKWGITQKVVCVTTDNANNIVAAVRLNKWNHIPCFAHTLNLIIQDSLQESKELTDIRKKCRNIVTYFHHSSKATDKLASIQARLNLDNLKLIQEVQTRWNSVFYMFERLMEQHEAVTTTLCLLDKSDLCLSSEEIECMKSAVSLLKPFEAATREVSGDSYVTVSKLIPLARSLQQLTVGTSTTTKLGDYLCLQMRRRFLNMESHHILSAATLLDPRLKKIAFADSGVAESCVRRLTSEMASTNESTMPMVATDTIGLCPTTTSTTRDMSGLWHLFDQQVAETRRTSTSNAMSEIRQYTQQKNLDRKEDLFLWWKQNCVHYPMLTKLAMKYLCIPGTSVPSERIFSKAGELVSVKRNRLKPKHVNIFLFLNKNI